MLNPSFKTLLVSSLIVFLLAACGGGSPGLFSEAEPPASSGTALMPAAQTFRSVMYPNGSLNALAVGDGIYVAAAQGGTVTSKDGKAWTISPKFTDENLTRVLYTGGRFVAFGDGGSMFSSVNGTDWSSVASGLPHMLDVIHTGTRFVARLDGGIATSEDGVNWTRRVRDDELKLTGFVPMRISIADGKLFAFTVASIFVSTDGLAWTRIPKPAAAGDKMPRAVSYGNGVYVLLAYYPKLEGEFSTGIPPGTQIYTSNDGITWVQHFASDSELLSDVNFVHGQFIATGANGVLRTSVDGIVWTARASGTTASLGKAFYFNNRYFVIATGGFIASADADTWSAAADSSVTRSMISVTEVDGRLFLLAPDRIGVSSDGFSWQFVEPLVGINKDTDVVFANGLFVAVGGGLKLHYTLPAPDDPLPKGWILTSPDGLHWTVRAQGADLSLESVTYGGGRFVAVGGRSVGNPLSSTILTSEDGIDWTRASAPIDTMLSQVVYGGGQYMAVGTDLVTVNTDPIMRFQGAVIGSPDGVNWTVRIPSIAGQAHGVANGNGRFVVAASLRNEVGDYQSVAYTSADGLAWSSRNSPYNLFAGVAFTNGVFVSGGGQDLTSSKDGMEWTRHPVGDVFLNRVTAVAGNAIAFFATDMERLYMTTTDGEHWTSHSLHQFGLGGMLSAAYGQSIWLMTAPRNGFYISP